MICESHGNAIRCAVYTRKSTDEGLEQEFNSLDAQREAAEAFIASQKQEGWECLSTRYDDGGYTGGNLERPAMRQLLRDIEDGQIDCVVVYKVDRLSRSLLDFSQMMATFEKHDVSFVSVTQQFNTTSSMGRLTLNILLSFAQFEREIISERTRDKMSAARRKGKYVGGAPILGYDIDRGASRLVVNQREAERVRKIFDLYLEHQSLLPTIRELDRREWTTKLWTTKKGKQRGGRKFNKNTLHSLLTNVAYVGKVKYRDEIYEGEHAAIVDSEAFEQVQRLLRMNHRSGGARVRNRFGALLKGMLHCVPCGCRMIPAHTTKQGNKRYRYYVCGNAQKRGWDNCPSKSIPAGEIERFVIEQIRSIGQEPELLSATLDQIRGQTQAKLEQQATERLEIEKDLQQASTDLNELVAKSVDAEGHRRQADLLDRLRDGEQRLSEICAATDRIRDEIISDAEVAEALRQFDPVWDALSPREQARVLELLIERIDYDGGAETVEITFHPTGFRQLTRERQLADVVA